MRHRIRKAKLGRTTEHRTRMLNNLVCSLIKHRRITTTLAKAKAARVVADKMVTLSKKGQGEDSLQYRRLVASRLQHNVRRLFPAKKGVAGRTRREQWSQNEDVVRILFEDITPGFEGRSGGYTRVIKLGRRKGDAAEMAILEWVGETEEAPAAEEKPAKQEKQAATAPEEEAADSEETTEEPAAEAEEIAEDSADNDAEETEESETESEEETSETEAEPEPEAEAAVETGEDDEKKPE